MRLLVALRANIGYPSIKIPIAELAKLAIEDWVSRLHGVGYPLSDCTAAWRSLGKSVYGG